MEHSPPDLIPDPRSRIPDPGGMRAKSMSGLKIKHALENPRDVIFQFRRNQVARLMLSPTLPPLRGSTLACTTY